MEIDKNADTHMAGYAPYLDYRPLTAEEHNQIDSLLAQDWLTTDLEPKVLSFAVSQLVPRHFEEVKRNKEELVLKTVSAVKDRLTKEINYWDHRANELKAQELEVRLQKRLEEREQERRLSPLPPVVMGGALIVPVGLLSRIKGLPETEPDTFARETARIERIAMDAIMELERQLGYEPRDVSAQKCGYDIESRIPDKGCLRFIEVKGRVTGAKIVTITKNEILTALNKPHDFVLAF